MDPTMTYHHFRSTVLVLLAALVGCTTPPAAAPTEQAATRKDVAAAPLPADYAVARALCLPTPLQLRPGDDPALRQACTVVIEAKREPSEVLAFAHFQRARAQWPMGTPDRILCQAGFSDVAAAATLMPNNPLMRSMYGVCLSLSGRHMEAARELEAARQSAPPAMQAMVAHARGDIYMRQTRCAEAIGAYDEAIQANPSDWESFRDRALCWLAAGQIARALDDATRAILLRPSDPLAYAIRANARRAQGDASGAQQDMLRARQLAPGTQFEFFITPG